MALSFHRQRIPEVVVVECDVFGDGRGFFLETYQHRKYADAGIRQTFVQDNHSHSGKGVLRGLHYQLRHPQGKLVTVITGTIFDVAVDIRQGSPTFGQWVGAELSAESPRRQIFVPEGFAHGFCVLSERADVVYKCTDYYDPGDDRGIVWSDPDLGIDWPVESPIVSEKDRHHPRLKDQVRDLLPVFEG